MSFQDPISDMISRIKNAQLRGHDKVSFESSKLKDGMYSEVSIPLGNIDESFSLSRSLLINDSYVYYIKSDMTIGIQNVEPIFYDDETVIVKGLKNEMLILKNYIPGVYDGMKVKIVD